VNIDENFFFPFRDELCGDGELKLKMIDVATIPQSHYKCQAFGEDIYGHRRMKSLGYKIRLDTTVIGRHIISWNESTTITHDMYSGLVLSIIIPVYNNTKFIKQIYEHIKKTVKVKHEIIFVNDGSTKES